jgi:hypothetical protein
MKQQAFVKELESFRLETDYLKHLTTLSSGAIIATVAFYANISQQQHQGFLLVALIGFLVTILASLFMNLRLVWCINDEDLEELPHPLMSVVDFVALFGGYLCFLSSVCMLVYFLYLNMGI